MPGKREDETCPLCKRGNLITEDREIALASGPTKDALSVALPYRLASACGVAPKASPIQPNPSSKTLFIGRTKVAVSHAADSPLAHTCPDPHRCQPLSMRSHAPEQDSAWGISMARRKNG
jgi:hypothetical protein